MGAKKKGKSLDKNVQKDEEICCPYPDCSGKLKRVTYKFAGCSANFYKCNEDFRHISVEVTDKYCSRPVYVEFSLWF